MIITFWRPLTKPDFKTNIWHEVLANVNGPEGVHICQLDNSDLLLFQSLVCRHFQRVMIEQGCTEIGPITQYHIFSEKIDHENVWSKKNRILRKPDFQTFIESNFLSRLTSDCKQFEISAEGGSGYPEVYFRLVRPSPFSDVGPLHADRWFWELNENTPYEERYDTRIKFWCSLFNDNFQTGFRYVKGSHLKDYQYTTEKRHGTIKPYFDENKDRLDVTELRGAPGTLIFFHDNLLHGGHPTLNKTRVSCEFTLNYQK